LIVLDSFLGNEVVFGSSPVFLEMSENFNRD